MQRIGLAVVLTLGLALPPGVGDVFSQEMSWDEKRCAGPEVSADQRISSCTNVIQSGRYDAEDLATTFSNRGLAYSAKGDTDRAIQDFDQAIRLDPQGAQAFNNPGVEYNSKRADDPAIQYDEHLRRHDKKAAWLYARGLAQPKKGRR